MPLFRPPLPQADAEHDNERGAVAVLVALFMLIFITLLAFVVDVGTVYATRSQLQNAADAAALAAVRDLPLASGNCSTAPNSTACVTARTYAASNGVPNALMSVVAPYGGNPNSVEVVTSQQVRFVFGPIIGQNGRIVTARAVATKSLAGGGGYALYAGNRVNFNGGGSDTAAITGSIFGGASGGGTCNSACPLDVPNGVGKVVVTGGDAYSPVVPGMKSNADITINGVVKHASQVDATTTTDPYLYAQQIGLIDVMNDLIAVGPVVGRPGPDCDIDLSNLSIYPVTTRVITCPGKATIRNGPGNPNLKLIQAGGGIEIDTDLGSAGNVVILSSGKSGGSAVMPMKGVTMYGTIYARYGEVRTNGKSFTLNQGRIISLDFLQNGNGGGFSASNVGDPYAQPSFQLVE